MPPTPNTFPEHFVWGVATAAPQIEGAARADGKGESVWDRFASIPGKVHGGDTLDEACDHYHLFDEDFALMRSLGITQYRLSIAWPRIYPNGDGPINEAGLDFYHRLFDAMAAHGITPWVTLFHWDLPQALEDRGGWTSRATVDAFGVYADTVVGAFAGKVKNWITLNEVRCFTELGYGARSCKAPGRREPPAVVNQTFHNALVCHGLGVRAVRARGGAGARVGLTDNCAIAIPVTETDEDIAAANAWFVDKNLQVLDPLYRGSYSAAFLEREDGDVPVVADGDFAVISLPTDFLGLNIYTGQYVRASLGVGYEEVPLPANYPRADSTWLNLTPQAVYWGLRFCHENYRPSALYVTENGCSYDVGPIVGGEIMDLHRREFLRSYLRELQRVIGDGVPVRGYFLWSFMDNFEWEDGYDCRFGIVHVDFATQKRTPKLSAHYYSGVIRANKVL